MVLAEKIYQKIQKLPESIQTEILDFVDFIDSRKGDPLDLKWNRFTLSSAMKGMENEGGPEYTLHDLKEKFQ